MNIRKKISTKNNNSLNPDEIHICGNCGHSDKGNYCSNCGQRFEEINKPLNEIFGDIFGIINLDSSIFRTIKPFLLKPGMLTQEYLEGRRKKYMSPIRFYLFLSIVFFFLANIEVKRTASGEGFSKFTISRNGNKFSISSPEGLNVLRTDSLYYVQTDTMQLSVNNKKKAERFREGLLAAGENPNLFRANLLKNISYSLFLLMPISALLLQLVYIRRKTYYVEHLLFAINMHSFVLFTGSVGIILKLLIKSGVQYEAFLLILIPVYFFAGMKRFYRQGFFKIFIKVISLGAVYLGMVTLAALGLSFLTIFRL